MIFAKYAYICAFLFSINVAMVPWIYSLGVSIFLFLFLLVPLLVKVYIWRLLLVTLLVKNRI